jgi:nucleotide-binding universal stress UspA family protein
MEPLGNVVVGIDGSDASVAALDLAAEEAVARVVPLLVVHARDEDAADRNRPSVNRMLDFAVSRACADHPSLSVAAAPVTGAAVDVLVDQSRDASLLVVGHRGHNGARQLRAGSVAQQVVNRAPVPVIVYRPLDTPARNPYEPLPVLVGVAGRPGDDQVVEFAFAEASLRGAPLRALHIWPGSLDTEAHDVAHGFAQERDEADRVVVDALWAWSEKYPDVSVHRVVRHGLDVPVALTAASKTAQLIVVGSTRLSGPLYRPWVSTALVHRAGCGVAVVPTG